MNIMKGKKKNTQSLSFPKTIVPFLYLKILYQLGYVPATLHGKKLFIVSNKSKIIDVMPSREVGTIQTQFVTLRWKGKEICVINRINLSPYHNLSPTINNKG